MMVRLARAGTREIMLGDTVKFARAAGLSEGAILRRHVLKLDTSRNPVLRRLWRATGVVFCRGGNQ
jgi:ABC-type dipeptide/oligopeptide/nickel transport system permease component